jgi:hypothetical protein
VIDHVERHTVDYVLRTSLQYIAVQVTEV